MIFTSINFAGYLVLTQNKIMQLALVNQRVNDLIHKINHYKELLSSGKGIKSTHLLTTLF